MGLPGGLAEVRSEHMAAPRPHPFQAGLVIFLHPLTFDFFELGFDDQSLLLGHRVESVENIGVGYFHVLVQVVRAKVCAVRQFVQPDLGGDSHRPQVRGAGVSALDQAVPGRSGQRDVSESNSSGVA